jgi:hypothetical protein
VFWNQFDHLLQSFLQRAGVFACKSHCLVGFLKVQLLIFAQVSNCFAKVVFLLIDRRKSLIQVLHDEIRTGRDLLEKIWSLAWFKFIIFHEGFNVL